MGFISYAQNLEDVMLWRALKHVEAGFYVDVGANDPDVHSVTRAFYERGWTGINVEPVPQWFERLQQKRKNDINLRVAAGAEPGHCILYEIPDTGLSTVNRRIAEAHESERGYTKIARNVEVDTLTAICRRYRVATIHFLKIDVEGAEREVVMGLDLSLIRPWIILVESTLPLTQQESSSEWAQMLDHAGYRSAYFDGLNRFYVAPEQDDLLAHFKVPPNVFDDFTPMAQAEAEERSRSILVRAQNAEQAADDVRRRLELAQNRARREQQRAEAAERAIAALRQQAQRAERNAQAQAHRAAVAEEQAHRTATRAAVAEDHIRALTTSRCWRYTAPLRWLVDTLRRRTPDEPVALATAAPGALSPRARAIHAELTTALADRHDGRT